jgi:ribose transport system ATP-binding protein
MKTNLILEIRGVSKVFGSTVALDGIDFELRKGEVHAIVGENGAGKSTLMKILSGAYTKDRGTILFDGESVDINSVEVSRNIGVSMIYQEIEDVPTVNVAENIFLGRLPRSKVPGFLNFKELFDATKKILHEYNVDINPQRKISTLTTGERQFIEIIRAVVVKNAKIVIMDEPTSSLTRSEVEKLFSIVGELRKKGISVIYISHRLDEVMGIADRVSVFRDGKNRGTLEKHELDPDRVVSLMIGHVLKRVEKKTSERKKVVFVFKKL